jgi:hypothetical protein
VPSRRRPATATRGPTIPSTSTTTPTRRGSAPGRAPCRWRSSSGSTRASSSCRSWSPPPSAAR